MIAQETIFNLNSNHVGQFHVFEDPMAWLGGERVRDTHHSSWNSLETAKVVAEKLDNGRVYNSFGELVYGGSHVI